MLRNRLCFSWGPVLLMHTRRSYIQIRCPNLSLWGSRGTPEVASSLPTPYCASLQELQIPPCQGKSRQWNLLQPSARMWSEHHNWRLIGHWTACLLDPWHTSPDPQHMWPYPGTSAGSSQTAAVWIPKWRSVCRCPSQTGNPKWLRWSPPSMNGYCIVWKMDTRLDGGRAFCSIQ